MNTFALYLCALLSLIVSAMAAGVGDFLTAALMLATVFICLLGDEVTK